jgi:cobalt-zinc-cadmium efflux system outer membrane protein
VKWFSLVLSLAVALVVRPARAAEETTQVTLDEAVVLLRRQSPELLAGALKVRAAQGDVTTARLYPNPTLSFGAGNFPIGRTNPPGIGAGDTVNEQVGIGQELVLWGKRGERIAAAHGRVAAAGAERADLDRRLVFEVRARFVRTLVAGERLRLARENLTHYRETVRVSRERADAGEISAAQYDKIALEQRGFEHEVADAEIERRQAVAELLPLLGLDVADLVPVGELRLPAARTDTDTLVSEALRRRPDLTAAEREAEAAEAALRLARAERWPNVTVGVQYTHDEFQVAGNLANSLGTNFSLPLPLVNRNQGEIQRAEAEALIARREVQKLRLGIPQEVRTAVTSYTVAGERVRRFEEAFLRQSEDARRAAEVSYREGAISLLEFVEAERTFIQTQRDHLDALLDGHMAAFDVIRAAALEAAP